MFGCADLTISTETVSREASGSLRGGRGTWRDLALRSHSRPDNPWRTARPTLLSSQTGSMT